MAGEADDTPIKRGKVKWFDPKKGYGFIEFQNRDIFLHISAVSADSVEPEAGDLVTFVEGRNRDGKPSAKEIVVVE